MKILIVFFAFVAVSSALKKCYRVHEDPEHPEKPICKGKHKYYTECGPSCPLTCEFPTGDAAASCLAGCFPGCFCKDGYLEDGNGNCVKPADCPPPKPLCDAAANEVYSVCNAFPACSASCENPLGPFPCRGICVAGCICTEGYVRSPSGKCVNVFDCPNKPKKCFDTLETGPCRGAFPRFGYDVESKSCVEFTYGGCEGNDNNYLTREACERNCVAYLEEVRQNVVFDTCFQQQDAGPCDATIPRYNYNIFSNKCFEFIYGGCGGNNNNYETIEKCNSTCVIDQP